MVVHTYNPSYAGDISTDAQLCRELWSKVVPGKKYEPLSEKRAQAVECLPSKCETLSPRSKCYPKLTKRLNFILRVTFFITKLGKVP
jgi:hypothetical protein